ncbi:radical SAM-linked protein/radical SAM family uncharacterized protein [Desulfacinum hydrothermale DSM 13146]|uniref:Radical SAM-linked protein/radical SAM family uncharacterized protein n=1 Tax=Desulfacinum hydrothermale DSM 13146 TaxID=1121390 RepID=A0A1W1XLT9_9BACT|nr:TIGR03960 family B12-binding radical SAM protein [Desulfacinum hydrothermale]SMC24478.1 radical SAM-linked protein/radical SAM family uncharacterized protein [Desulfacinum hydrothermale DSM 13146]
MKSINLDDLLINMERPARYTGGETHARLKDFDAATIRMALAFPDVYEVGMSHLGLHILYHLLNDMEEVMADRVYTPWPDFERRLRETGTPLYGLESRKPLNRFHLVGFSLQYELSYTNVLTMLDLGGIPLRSAERGNEDPFVIAGGPCAFNPEPLAPFLDLVLLGEAEEALKELLDMYRRWQGAGASRREFLEEVRKIPGVYVPAFFSARYDAAGRLEGVEPLYADYTHVRKRLITDLDRVSPPPLAPLVPLADIVHNRLGLEIARGCTRGCRFCQAGYIYRPVRERDPVQVLERAQMAIDRSGFEEVSLLSLSTGDYCQVGPLLRALMDAVGDKKVAVSLPSMRVGTLTQDLMQQIRKVRKTGFTVAPEAGSERLRRVINKNISDADLLTTARTAYDLGWNLMKLYFMMGLPTETLEDLDALAALSLEVWKAGKARKGKVNVSVSTFVPKPMTPFQWVGQISKEEIERRLAHLKGRLQKPGVRLKWHDPDQSVLEAVFARGDRRLADVIEDAWRHGARFDGWAEWLRMGTWLEAFQRAGVDPFQLAQRSFEKNEVLPWDHLSAGLDKDFLWKEYEKAHREDPTEDCRWNPCSQCGVCDHKIVRPHLHKAEPALRPSMGPSAALGPGVASTYRFRYAKCGLARFLGQLEVARLFERACRRSHLPVVFSQGFHPHPKISFSEALPLGMESEAEEGTIQLERAVLPSRIQEVLNAQLPEGLRVLQVQADRAGHAPPRERLITYRVSHLTPSQVDCIIKIWRSRPRLQLVKKTKRGQATAPLTQVVESLERLDPTAVVLRLVDRPGLHFRPQAVLEQMMADSAPLSGAARVCKVSVDPLES